MLIVYMWLNLVFVMLSMGLLWCVVLVLFMMICIVWKLLSVVCSSVC